MHGLANYVHYKREKVYVCLKKIADLETDELVIITARYLKIINMWNLCI